MKVIVLDIDNYKTVLVTVSSWHNMLACLAAKRWQLFLHLPPSAALVLLWSYLMYTHYFFGCRFADSFIAEMDPSTWQVYGFVIFSCLGYFSFPVLGLLADIWIGRYKAILCGIVLCFMSMAIIGIGYIVTYYFVSKKVLWSFFVAAYLFQFGGFTSFTANIIQYNIDQLVGPSADELNTLIYLYILFKQLLPLLFYPLQCLFNGELFAMIIFILCGLSVSLVLVSHSFLQHKLENISLIKNPIKLIVRVLCYARKHRYPENRSALTYWEEEAPSRLDLGKEKYGGPFTEEEVEDVKTVFGILPLFAAVFVPSLSDDSYWSAIDSFTFTTCFTLTDSQVYLSSVILMSLYILVIRACFHKYIPSMLSLMGAGLVVAIFVVMSKVIIFWRSQSEMEYVGTMLFIPQTLEGVSFTLVCPVSLAFTVAQSPVHSRGVMVGVWYTSWELGFFISTIIKFPFHCQSQYICTSFYYYLAKAALVLIILILFVILAKRYKYRVRENEVNIIQIVDDHYQRYMKQEEQYSKNHNNNEIEISSD